MNTFLTDEQFLSHYKLEHDPFAARVPNFKFFSAQRKTILGQMHHLARHSQLMLIITGPQDSGKTLLRQALIASLNKDAVRIVNVSAKDCTTPSQMINVVADSLSLTFGTPEKIIEALNKLAEENTGLYLMVDDAQDLADETLQLLLNFTSEQLKSFHIFLFARPVLLEKLENSTLGKEVTFNLPLTPYTLDETKEYIASRLEGAGQKINLFSEAQLLDIYTCSGGWPGVINQVAKDLLLTMMEESVENSAEKEVVQEEPFTDPVINFENAKEEEPVIGSLFTEKESEPTSFFEVDEHTEKKKNTSFIPKKHLVIAAAIAIVLLGIIFFSKSSSKSEVTNDSTLVADHYATLPENDEQTTSLPLNVSQESDANTSQSLPLSVDNSVASTEPATTTNNSVPVTDTAEVTHPQETVPVAPVEQTVVEQPKVEVESKVATNTEVKPAAEPVKTQPKVATKNLNIGNAWYNKQISSYYTIQVSVASTERLARDFIQKQTGDYHYYKRSRAGKVDYVITYGRFASSSLAQTEIKKLPKDVQSSKPWIRTFASIKAELAK